MADESADLVNEEQLVIYFRSVDNNFEIHEDFIGLHIHYQMQKLTVLSK